MKLKGYRCFYFGYTNKGTFRISDSRKKFDKVKVEKRFNIMASTEQMAVNKIHDRGMSIGNRSTT